MLDFFYTFECINDAERKRKNERKTIKDAVWSSRGERKYVSKERLKDEKE